MNKRVPNVRDICFSSVIEVSESNVTNKTSRTHLFLVLREEFVALLRHCHFRLSKIFSRHGNFIKLPLCSVIYDIRQFQKDKVFTDVR